MANRRTAAAIGLAIAIALSTVGSAEAAPQAESFAGCPLLVEGQNDDVCVWKLQHFLNQTNSSYMLEEDGNFGASTRVAVLDFQGKNDLPADGNVGADTARALETAAGWDPSARVVSPAVLADGCEPEAFASLEDYLTGRASEPKCFPYDPKIVDSPLGPRAQDIYGDGCSGGPKGRITDDENGLRDHRRSCATHDYASDLIRYGVDTFSQPEMDDYFLRDLLADCEESNGDTGLASRRCREEAYAWRSFVRWGNPKAGDNITDAKDN